MGNRERDDGAASRSTPPADFLFFAFAHDRLSSADLLHIVVVGSSSVLSQGGHPLGNFVLPQSDGSGTWSTVQERLGREFWLPVVLVPCLGVLACSFPAQRCMDRCGSASSDSGE